MYLCVPARTTVDGNGLFFCTASPHTGLESSVGLTYRILSGTCRKWRQGWDLHSLCFPPLSPLMYFLALLQLPLSSRNFLPLSSFCFNTRHSVTAMPLATVESVRETESNIWNELPPCQPIYWANLGRHFTYSTFFHPSLPVCSLGFFFFFFWALVIWRKKVQYLRLGF